MTHEEEIQHYNEYCYSARNPVSFYLWKAGHR